VCIVGSRVPGAMGGSLRGARLPSVLYLSPVLAPSLDTITISTTHYNSNSSDTFTTTMRAAARLFASVKPGQFLESGAPTGLTGLRTHPSPRSTLLYHYNATLDKLKEMPESSVYRQSTEALTRHRLKVVEESIPEGWAKWQEKIQSQIAQDPGAFEAVQTSGGTNIRLPKSQDIDPRLRAAQWDGEVAGFLPEGIRSEKERKKHIQMMKGDKDYNPERTFSKVVLEPEPLYTIEAYVQFKLWSITIAH
jgi:NADH dehydrogenase (ubiquinone) 1 alpha subcomplex subunit 5